MFGTLKVLRDLKQKPLGALCCSQLTHFKLRSLVVK